MLNFSAVQNINQSINQSIQHSKPGNIENKSSFFRLVIDVDVLLQQWVGIVGNDRTRLTVTKIKE
jgi:hypothetical protein